MNVCSQMASCRVTVFLAVQITVCSACIVLVIVVFSKQKYVVICLIYRFHWIMLPSIQWKFYLRLTLFNK